MIEKLVVGSGGAFEENDTLVNKRATSEVPDRIKEAIAHSS